MHIRPYTLDDLSAVVDTYQRSVHVLGAERYDAAQLAAWAPPDPDMEVWAERLVRAITRVADADGEIAGFISFEASGYVDLLFVSPKWARRGVASRLFRDAEREMVAAAATELTTHASMVARPFFEHHGFVIVETEDVARHGAVLRRFVMRKEVQ